MAAKLSSKRIVVNQPVETVGTGTKVRIPHAFTPVLGGLLVRVRKDCLPGMLYWRSCSSSKYYPEIPGVVAKSPIVKYQRKQVKRVDGGLKIPARFKKEVLPVVFPKPVWGFIRQVEFFKRQGQWLASVCYNTPAHELAEVEGVLGVDRNSAKRIPEFHSGSIKLLVRIVLVLLAGILCAGAMSGQTSSAPTIKQAEEFMKRAEARLSELSVQVNRAGWVEDNFITDDTEALSAEAQDQATAVTTELVGQARRFEKLKMPPKLARKFMLLRLSLTAPAPKDPALRKEMTKISTSLEAEYGKGKYCRKPDDCLDITAIERIMGSSQDPSELKDLWVGWNKVGAPMRDRYGRFVQLSNQGAREIGFRDTGAMWRSGYDMNPEEFSAEIERLWQQVRPLYLSLHTFVRARLSAHYGPGVVPPDGPIPADLLGNPWAQEWGNIYPLLGMPANSSGYELTELLKAKPVDPRGMVKYAENFFVSMGFPPLPPTFWERSLFTKPADRDVVCHASAWDIDNQDDLRIKVCLQVRDVDFVTVHHELGHNMYQRAYEKQPFLFENGANDGFHEAIGDSIALAITPEYLQKVGLLDQVPSADADISQLLKQALDRVAFLPFGFTIDQWRWKVFSGEIKPADYNQAWWDLRLKYQGIAPPVARSEQDFDPGAKYHIAANVPYVRYFLAYILEFQFYRALCHEAGYTGPLNRCTFFGSKEAGAKFEKMLAMGQSKPWPDALEVLTGQRQMDASAILEYFAPLQKWLDEQNQGQKVGW